MEPETFRMESNNSNIEPCSPLDTNASIMHNKWLMAKK